MRSLVQLQYLPPLHKLVAGQATAWTDASAGECPERALSLLKGESNGRLEIAITAGFLSFACMKEVMLTLIGPDKTGVVASVAAIAGKAGGNWLDSRMIRMGGYFSGLLRIALPESSISKFGSDISDLMRDIGYQYSIQAAELITQAPADAVSAELALSGQDHPGIVHSIFRIFQLSGVNVEELSTGLRAAPWSGTPVFEANARLLIPPSVDVDALQQNLESIAADLMVEVALNPA